MQTFILKIAGCDNGSGKFELGGELDLTNEVNVANILDLGTAVAGAVLGTVRHVTELSTTKVGQHYMVSFTDNKHGQCFAVVATPFTWER